jgi:hypothetical protein
MRRIGSLYTKLGFNRHAANSTQESLVKYLKMDAEQISPHSFGKKLELKSEHEQLSFNDEILQAGNFGPKRAA